jgi:hypothetical protein
MSEMRKEDPEQGKDFNKPPMKSPKSKLFRDKSRFADSLHTIPI